MFTGEITPSETESMDLKDKRRWYLNELKSSVTKEVLDFF